MRKNMLAYYQDVLDRISHADRRVFRKEMRKALRGLDALDRERLKAWFRERCVCRVGTRYSSEALEKGMPQLK